MSAGLWIPGNIAIADDAARDGSTGEERNQFARIHSSKLTMAKKRWEQGTQSVARPRVARGNERIQVTAYRPLPSGRIDQA